MPFSVHRGGRVAPCDRSRRTERLQYDAVPSAVAVPSPELPQGEFRGYLYGERSMERASPLP
jgi:hypothetical protein